ncbi:hypothetical protein JIQ42_06041 [Leishmania sp. Namibia]|uniref:hypothetical protein n=1 Tax=Leishmania sp. Namibia TaxID=2802991 RepID=UPI001B58AB05|nr:hypothetical protein JIQ42_06041 [Leishmania sp. Namibia]
MPAYRDYRRLPTTSSVPRPNPGWCTTNALQLLDLSGAELTDGGPLSSLVASCPHPHSLSLSDKLLGTRDAELALLCAALQEHPSLEVLNLSRNGISGSRGVAARAVLAELIVARSVEAPDSLLRASVRTSAPFGQDVSAATAVVAQPLRRVDLSDNLLGTEFLLLDTTERHCADE